MSARRAVCSLPGQANPIRAMQSIDAAMQALHLAAVTDDAARIEAQTKALAQATEAFAAQRMNRGIAQALSGKNIASM